MGHMLELLSRGTGDPVSESTEVSDQDAEFGDFVEQLTDYFEATERAYRSAVASGSVPYGLTTSTNFGGQPAA